tara:strand:+ start:1313 stop:2068 length:756 start_codon:yes stop_codon:yes gene_type:complete
MKNLIHTGIIAGLALGASTVSQAAVPTTSDTAPTGTILISNDTASNVNMTVRVNEPKLTQDRTLGQSFTLASAGSFNAISVQLKGGGAATVTNNFSALTAGQGNLLLNVFDLSGGGKSLIASPVVYDMAGLNLGSLNNHYLTFDLGETVTLSAGIEYGFELGWDPTYLDEEDTIYRNLALVRTVGGDVFSGGAQIGKGNYTSFPNVSLNSGPSVNDLDFYVHTVPEPSTYALLAGSSPSTGDDLLALPKGK